MQICIIGAGVTGLLLLLLLQNAGISSSEICIVDPFFDGGDLARAWTHVLSNTPWSKTVDALKSIGLTLPSWATTHSPDAPTPLHWIARLLRELAPLDSVQRIQGTVLEANWTAGAWTVLVQRERAKQTIRATVLCATQGADANRLDLPVPAIPLDVALTSSRLAAYIKTSDSIVVFGTRHSGSLVLKNLLELAPQQITAVYKGATPFLYASDGEYDGLKLEAAEFAKHISPSIHFLALDDFSAVSRAVRDATWVVYCIGFSSRQSFRLQQDGQDRQLDYYDGTTGRLLAVPNAWGFGIAYPSRAPDGVHWDVGIASFAEHIQAQISDIKSAALSK